MILLTAITALLIHESGHLWVALACGQPAKGLVYHWWGIGVRIGRSPIPWVNAMIAAGGPMASLIAFVAFGFMQMGNAAAWNLAVLLVASVFDFWNIGRELRSEA